MAAIVWAPLGEGFSASIWMPGGQGEDPPDICVLGPQDPLDYNPLAGVQYVDNFSQSDGTEYGDTGVGPIIGSGQYVVESGSLPFFALEGSLVNPSTSNSAEIYCDTYGSTGGTKMFRVSIGLFTTQSVSGGVNFNDTSTVDGEHLLNFVISMDGVVPVMNIFGFSPLGEASSGPIEIPYCTWVDFIVAINTNTEVMTLTVQADGGSAGYPITGSMTWPSGFFDSDINPSRVTITAENAEANGLRIACIAKYSQGD